MAVSEVQICNLALSKIGDEFSISAIGEDGREGEQCELFFEHTRDHILQSHPWNFAIGRSALSQDATSPAFEYTNQFLLPGDFLRALSLYNEQEPFKIEGDRLLTDASTANLVYIKKVTNTVLFPPLFTEILVTRLAAEMSQVISDDNALTERLFIESDKKLREAKRRDGQEGTPDNIISRGPTDFKNGFFK
jgi:hypothetical protein